AAIRNAPASSVVAVRENQAAPVIEIEAPATGWPSLSTTSPRTALGASTRVSSWLRPSATASSALVTAPSGSCSAATLAAIGLSWRNEKAPAASVVASRRTTVGRPVRATDSSHTPAPGTGLPSTSRMRPWISGVASSAADAAEADAAGPQPGSHKSGKAAKPWRIARARTRAAPATKIRVATKTTALRRVSRALPDGFGITSAHHYRPRASEQGDPTCIGGLAGGIQVIDLFPSIHPPTLDI